MNVFGEAQLAAVHLNLRWHFFENTPAPVILLIMWTAFNGLVGIIKKSQEQVFVEGNHAPEPE